MTRYEILLYPGFGVNLERFVSEGYDEYDALNGLAYRLRGSAYVITYDQFDEIIEERMSDGYTETEAVAMTEEMWLQCDAGLCLYVNGAQIRRLDDPPACSGNRKGSKTVRKGTRGANGRGSDGRSVKKR